MAARSPGFIQALARLFFCIRTCVCWLDGQFADPARCSNPTSGPTCAAVCMFAFGVWMLLLGSAFVGFTLWARNPLRTRLESWAGRLGIPAKNAVWSRLFGGALAAFSLFYFAAAVFELRTFFWMSIFGRLGIFGTCVVLSWHDRARHAGAPARPHTLVLLAVPDLLFALATAFVMLPDVLASLVFVSGVALLVIALGFFTFPHWLVSVLGLRVKPDTWSVIVGSLLAFFGAYGVAASLLGLMPIMWAAVVANAFLLVWLLVNVVREPRPYGADRL